MKKIDSRCDIEKYRDKKSGRFVALGNDYLVEGDIVYCYNKQGELLFFTNADQFEKIKKFNWCKLAMGYSSAKHNGKQVAAHRILTDCPDTMLVDHINHNKKDNRRENLRICTKSQNAFNCTKNSNTSGRQGVWWRKDTNKWCAEIKVDGKKHSLGCFTNFEDAVAARASAEEKYTEGFAYDDK